MEIANEKVKTKFLIPVTWKVYDTVEVQAASLEEAYEYVQNNIDNIPLGTEPEYTDNSYEICAESFEDIVNYQKNDIVCLQFECDEKLSKYTDSMLFSATSESGISIASGEFIHKGRKLYISLDVCGETRITYKGEVYKNLVDYPTELLNLMTNNPSRWELDEDVYVGNNNWFEYIISGEDKSDGVVYEKDLSKATEQDILNDMTAIAGQYFNL